MSKIVSKEKFKNEIRPLLKKENKTIVLCHGVFDVVHPGHIIHLEQAKNLGGGGILVVSVTASKYVRKGPGRPYFNDEMRMKFLEALECVDYVMLSEGYTVDDIVEVVEPDIYVKGEEYAKAEDDLTGKINEEKALVEKHGGVIRYTTGQTYSSTKLINTVMAGLPEDVIQYAENFKQSYSIEDIKMYADKASALKILVVGDIIIDKYTYCRVQGLMSKDMGYSARISNSEEYLGGAIAVARHLSSFSSNITLLSMVGSEQDLRTRLHEELSEQMNLKLIVDEEFPTIIKHRYLTKNAKREEYRKVLAVNNIPEKMRHNQESRERFLKELDDCICGYDVVFLCDFGHGLIDGDTMELIQQKARFLVLNCQTNSTNKGMNIITKYHRADAFACDQQELRLAFPMYMDDEEMGFAKLSEHLHSKGWLTRGALGAYGIANGKMHNCPAFTLTVKDTVGAGDAFLAVAGVFSSAGAPIEIGTFVGNIAGALGANIVGNKEAVEKVNILKYANTLLNV